MASNRRVNFDFINIHLPEWFKALKSNEEHSILLCCEKLLEGRGKLRKANYKEFQKCIEQVKKTTWENFLRRCRDKKYEGGRSRTSIKKSTFKLLDNLRAELEIDSNDTLILKLVESYQNSRANGNEDKLIPKPKTKFKKKYSALKCSNNNRKNSLPEEFEFVD